LYSFFLDLDNAYACDPRIKKFKDDEKERKLAEKKAKEEAARAAAEEKERVSTVLQSKSYLTGLSFIPQSERVGDEEFLFVILQPQIIGIFASIPKVVVSSELCYENCRLCQILKRGGRGGLGLSR